MVNENDNENENGNMEPETMKPETQYRYLQAEGNIFNWDYAHLVAAIVRAKYSADDVEAILLNGNDDALTELNAWRDKAKNLVANLFSMDKELEGAKAKKLRELDSYDTSSSVNSFTLSGNTMWLSLEKRKDMRQSLTALKAMGVETFTYWLGTTPITMPVEQFEAMLNAVEVYAIQCYNVTAQHKASIEALTDIAEVEAYDYTIGYPDKLSF